MIRCCPSASTTEVDTLSSAWRTRAFSAATSRSFSIWVRSFCCMSSSERSTCPASSEPVRSIVLSYLPAAMHAEHLDRLRQRCGERAGYEPGEGERHAECDGADSGRDVAPGRHLRQALLHRGGHGGIAEVREALQTRADGARVGEELRGGDGHLLRVDDPRLDDRRRSCRTRPAPPRGRARSSPAPSPARR